MTSGTEGALPGDPGGRAPHAHWPSDSEIERLRQGVLRNSAELWRDFPWRATRDPWFVLVSEVMLQQTQAPRVVEPFTRFVARFPTPAACADAGRAEVVRAWAGLGYNRRAVNLHRTATIVVERHGGRLPDELDALEHLPGVGPYTARAVLAFAYARDRRGRRQRDVRVLSRAAAGGALTRRQAQRLADRLVPPSDAWRFNQALIDFGARCCTARAPRCGSCHLLEQCRWAQAVAGNGAGTALPGTASPGTASPGTASPGTASPGTAAPGTAAPDPAAPTRRRQGRFAGSDREGRGRLVRALRLAPVPARAVATTAGWPDDELRALRVAEALVAEGLASWQEGALALA
ncbi:MAG: A/G-specific adenine glycosylase [Actinomycetota bacterium]|nr:A/G-specific adenine glycosylase [Actinomycetota bacterium]